ncbi:MAG TPA: DnaB-like helicase N-terminal domain-containing protein [Gemmatimonadaceae bacterium]
MHERSNSERTLPHNLDAERSVLGSCLLHAESVPEVAAVLNPHDFYLVRHEVIFRALLAVHADKGVTDPISVAEELHQGSRLEEVGGHPQLLDLLEGVVTAAGVIQHAEIVLEKARQRRLIEKCFDVASRCFDGECADGLTARLREITEPIGGTSGSVLPLMSLADLGATGQRDQLVDGLLFADSLNALCGPQKQFKTVVADALLCAVAEGSEFLGRKVERPGLCIDFALEGMAGKPARYRAQLGVPRFNDTSDPVHKRLFLLPVVPDITTTAGQDLVLRTIENVCKRTGETLRAAKYDTVARAMATARLDENSTAEMGAWIAGLDRIRTQIPHAQLLVHHTGKNGLERGSSALPGAVDLLAFVQKTGHCEAKVTVRDARDIEVPNPWLVRFAPVVVGQLANGRPVTAMRIDSVQVMTAASITETPEKPTSRHAILELADEAGDEGFDFKSAKAATTKAGSTTSYLLKKLTGAELQEFTAPDGTKKWRRRPR